MRQPLPLLERFENLTLPEPNSGCWLWLGPLYRDGYGAIEVADKYRKQYGFSSKSQRAHRLSYELYCGPIGDLQVLHKCDIACCVNPKHLFLGTAQDNVDDMMRKGRNRTGIRPKIVLKRRKSHCVHGHALTPDNIYISPSGCRRCRQCMLINNRDWHSKNKRIRKPQVHVPNTTVKHTVKILRKKCKRGHDFIGDNIYLNKTNGSRHCKMCMALAAKKYEQKRKAKGPRIREDRKKKRQSANGTETSHPL